MEPYTGYYIEIDSDAIDVMRILINNGYEAYVVGGAVRDSLLGREVHDWDIATNARPHEVMDLFESYGWTTVDVGSKYGVVVVVHPETHREFEVATFRRELYTVPGERRSLVAEFADTLEEDVKRRDFTVNALAADITGEVIDYVGGIRDLREGVIRFVGVPEERIREDPLRMLRAIRFTAVLGFRLDDAAFNAVRSMYNWLSNVSWERIGEEITKACKGQMHLFTYLLYESLLYRIVMPELEDMARVRHGYGYTHRGETVLEHTIEVLSILDDCGCERITKLAGLLHDVGKPRTYRVEDGKVRFKGHEVVGAEMARDILYRWRMPRKLVNLVTNIVRNHMAVLQMGSTYRDPRSLASRAVSKWGEAAPYLLELAYGDSLGDRLYLEAARIAGELLATPKPVVTGDMIMRLYGVKPGPEVGRIKRELYEIQLRYGITDPETIIEIACREKGICPRS